MDERELVRSARSGDRSAFEELVKSTYLDTYTLAFRLTGDEEDARDVTQESYLRAWKGIGRFRGDAQFSTWLYRITANTAASHHRRQRRRRTEPLGEHPEPAQRDGESQPVEAAEAADLLDRLSVAIADLPPKLRQVVVLRDVYGLSHDAIAEELSISTSAAKVRLHRARRKLHDVLLADDPKERADAV